MSKLSSSKTSAAETGRQASRADPVPQQANHDLSLSPGLYVVSTPIGNLRDITLRALDVLSGVDEILAEDTRQTRKLLDAYGLKAKLTPYHDHNGAERRPELMEKLLQGARIALVSDAGTPLVSDPGFKLVRDVARDGIPVIPVPGASAPLAALVASGLPSDRFLFAGFPPPKSKARRDWLSDLSGTPATLIFFESGNRLADTLADISEIMGSARDAAVARELTKLFEEVRRAPVAELAEAYASEAAPKGEIVLLLGPPSASVATGADIDAALVAAMKTEPTKAAAQIVAERFGLSRRDVYQRALGLKSGRESEG